MRGYQNNEEKRATSAAAGSLSVVVRLANQNNALKTSRESHLVIIPVSSPIFKSIIRALNPIEISIAPPYYRYVRLLSLIRRRR